MINELDKCVVLWKGKSTQYSWKLLDESFETFEYCQNTLIPYYKNIYEDHSFKIMKTVEFDNSVKYER